MRKGPLKSAGDFRVFCGRALAWAGGGRGELRRFKTPLDAEWKGWVSVFSAPVAVDLSNKECHFQQQSSSAVVPEKLFPVAGRYWGDVGIAETCLLRHP